MKENKLFKKIIILPVILIIGGLFGYFVGGIIAKSNVPSFVIFISFLLVLPTYFLAVAIHELGHAIAGIKVGFDFRMFLVGPLLWEKNDQKWIFKWNTNINTAGGMALCMPTDTHNLKNRFTAFVAGGPIASLLLTILSTIFYFLISQGRENGIFLQVLGVLFIVTSLVSFILFLSTSIPMRTGGFYTDGARIMRIQKGGDEAQFEYLILKLTANTAKGVRPRDLVTEDLEEISDLSKKLNEPFGVYVHSYLHQAAFDKNEIDQAEKHLEDYIFEANNIPDGIRNSVWLDAAFFYAYAKKDIVKADEFWQKFKPSAITPKAQILATEAAIASLKEDKKTAYLKIDKTLPELNKMIDKGVAIALREKMEVLKLSL